MLLIPDVYSTILKCLAGNNLVKFSNSIPCLHRLQQVSSGQQLLWASAHFGGGVHPPWRSRVSRRSSGCMTTPELLGRHGYSDPTIHGQSFAEPPLPPAVPISTSELCNPNPLPFVSKPISQHLPIFAQRIACENIRLSLPQFWPTSAPAHAWAVRCTIFARTPSTHLWWKPGVLKHTNLFPSEKGS